MRAEGARWMGEHAKMLTLTEMAGKTKAVTASGTTDIRNDIIVYSFVEADSHESAPKRLLIVRTSRLRNPPSK
jgi:hypothetical protein